MPLSFIQKINNDSSWVLWEIHEEIGNFFLQMDLMEEEKSFYNTISNHYKKLEWLATRVALRKLMESLNLEYDGITKDEHGKPHLVNENGMISVTHSYPYVAVIYHRKLDVGIDLEHPREKILKISKKFLNDREMLIANGNVDKTTMLWSAKEALYKLHGRKFVIFKDNLEIDDFKTEKEGMLKGHIRLNGSEFAIDMKYYCNEKYIVTYTVR
jgi:phosphopantetheinyl transferase